MLLNRNTDARDHSSCTLRYDEQNHWLSAVWSGYVDPAEAQRGGAAYLLYAQQRPSPYLLNDNSRLRGPWFTSLEWLDRVWVPHAARLGLRYVAHVGQADRPYDILSASPPASTLPFELQFFEDVGDAQQWLRECRASLRRR